MRPRGRPSHPGGPFLVKGDINAEQIASGDGVGGRGEFVEHVAVSWPEYNRRYAHPFEWTWTNQKMRQWFARHAT